MDRCICAAAEVFSFFLAVLGCGAVFDGRKVMHPAAVKKEKFLLIH